MADPKRNHLRNGRFIGILAAVIAAALGSGAVGYYIISGMGPEQLQAMARPDPFTGTEGRALEGRINTLQRQIDALPPRALILDVAWCRQEIGFLRGELDEHKHEHELK